jgi:Rhodopirellula transposase DDE domain
VNLATIVSLIGSTHNRCGLRVRSEIDRGRYPGGLSVTDAQMATVRLKRHRFHGEWNYTICPTARAGRARSVAV